MEIHVPRKAITSMKDLSRELAIVTVGILIALSLEGLVQWRHHHELERWVPCSLHSCATHEGFAMLPVAPS